MQRRKLHSAYFVHYNRDREIDETAHGYVRLTTTQIVLEQSAAIDRTTDWIRGDLSRKPIECNASKSAPMRWSRRTGERCNQHGQPFPKIDKSGWFINPEMFHEFRID